MTDETIRALAERWLERQKATSGDDCLDEGDCRMCGTPTGESHEPTDPCGIISGLLAALARQGEELARCLADEEMTDRRAERAEQERDEARAALAKEKEK